MISALWVHMTYWLSKCVTKLCDSPDWLIQTCHQSARVCASGCHCRKMQRNNKFGAKILIWRQLLAKKKIAGEIFVWRWNITSRMSPPT